MRTAHQPLRAPAGRKVYSNTKPDKLEPPLKGETTMNQSISNSLIAADEADDILQYLALGILKTREIKMKSQPDYNVIELYKWMPDNQKQFVPQGEEATFEQTPSYAIVDKSAGDGHFCFEAFRLLRDCFDAGAYTVRYIPQQGLAILEPSDYMRLRRRILPWIAKGKETEGIERLPDEKDRKLFPLPPHPEVVLADLSGILRPLTRQKFDRDTEYMKDHLYPPDGLDANSVSDDTLLAIGVSTMTRRIETIHQFWLICQEKQSQLKHPLTPIVYTWLCQQDAKRITLEFDKRRPVAILPQESMGSIRDLVFTRDEGGSVSSELIARPAPKEKQLTLWKPDATDSLLPDILPFELYQQGAATTKSAAVAMPVRLAFEALLHMEPGVHSERLHWKLGDLIDYLNPDGKFNWTNQLSYILDGLSALYWLRFPYTPNGEGEVDWIPFLPRTVPTHNSNRESRIIIEVSLPPDLIAQGMMVEKNVIRLLGKKSSARFNAYLTACWVFDHYGTVNGKIIDPTMPEERRNHRGELVGRDDKPILNAQGKPVTNAKSAEAARKLDRTINPGKDKYPILNNYDLIRSCYPRGVPTAQQREYLRRAKKAWTELESDGFVRIDRLDSGWRIMPSEQHVSRYRALKSRTWK